MRPVTGCWPTYKASAPVQRRLRNRTVAGSQRQRVVLNALAITFHAQAPQSAANSCPPVEL